VLCWAGFEWHGTHCITPVAAHKLHSCRRRIAHLAAATRTSHISSSLAAAAARTRRTCAYNVLTACTSSRSRSCNAASHKHLSLSITKACRLRHNALPLKLARGLFRCVHHRHRALCAARRIARVTSIKTTRLINSISASLHMGWARATSTKAKSRGVAPTTIITYGKTKYLR